MRFATRLLSLLAAVVLVAGCGGAVPGDAAATVNGVEVPRDLFESVVDSSVDAAVATAEETQGELDSAQRDELVAERQRQVLSLLVQDSVITAVAEDAGVEIDDAALTEVRSGIVDAIGGEEQLEQLLSQDGLSLELFDEVLVPQQARVLALQEQLADGETLETRTTRHILVEDEALADEIVAELEGGADFAELAAEHSIDGSSEQGGELPPAPRGSYVPEFEEAVWDAELEALVGPVQSQFGFHVLEVLAEEVTPAEELDDAQLGQLVGPELNTLITDAFAEAEVEVDPAFGVWDPATRSVVPEDRVGEPSEPAVPAPGAPTDPAPEAPTDPAPEAPTETDPESEPGTEPSTESDDPAVEPDGEGAGQQ